MVICHLCREAPSESHLEISLVFLVSLWIKKDELKEKKI